MYKHPLCHARNTLQNPLSVGRDGDKVNQFFDTDVLHPRFFAKSKVLFFYLSFSYYLYYRSRGKARHRGGA